MAITKNMDTQYGLTVPGAYIRVEQIAFNQAKDMLFFVRIYAKPNFPPIAERQMCLPYAMDGANPFAQAYAHLKTLPEFSGAADC